MRKTKFGLVLTCKNTTEGIIYLKAELDTKADVVYDKINFYVKGDYYKQESIMLWILPTRLSIQ